MPTCVSARSTSRRADPEGGNCAISTSTSKLWFSSVGSWPSWGFFFLFFAVLWVLTRCSLAMSCRMCTTCAPVRPKNMHQYKARSPNSSLLTALDIVPTWLCAPRLPPCINCLSDGSNQSELGPAYPSLDKCTRNVATNWHMNVSPDCN